MVIDLRCGDALEVLRTLPGCSVQCCVTSPPYWRLRDYGTAKWEGGDDKCDHIPTNVPQDNNSPGRRCSTLCGSTTATTEAAKGLAAYRDTCGKCGARRIDRQIGLEETPEEFVAKMVAVFREVRRVLRSDGVCWMNLGDSYNGMGGHGKQDGGSIGKTAATAIEDTEGRRIPGLKPKDLVGIPWRVAFALQADGWWLRQDIIWHKPNPMPESVRDRCTKAHEYVFLLTKSARYYYDAEAVAETAAYPGDNRALRTDTRKAIDTFCADGGSRARTEKPTGATRNRRSVWTVVTQPYSGAHFAVMPEALVEPCIAAGSREGDTVLDPFAGSGTVGAVCARMGRSFIGIDLNEEYLEMARRRIAAVAPLFFMPPS